MVKTHYVLFDGEVRESSLLYLLDQLLSLQKPRTLLMESWPGQVTLSGQERDKVVSGWSWHPEEDDVGMRCGWAWGPQSLAASGCSQPRPAHHPMASPPPLSFLPRHVFFLSP